MRHNIYINKLCINGFYIGILPIEDYCLPSDDYTFIFNIIKNYLKSILEEKMEKKMISNIDLLGAIGDELDQEVKVLNIDRRSVLINNISGYVEPHTRTKHNFFIIEPFNQHKVSETQYNDEYPNHTFEIKEAITYLNQFVNEAVKIKNTSDLVKAIEKSDKNTMYVFVKSEYGIFVHEIYNYSLEELYIKGYYYDYIVPIKNYHIVCDSYTFDIDEVEKHLKILMNVDH